jgi:hypothetical protein
MKVLTVISAFLLFSTLYSQEDKERSIYLEVGGSGGLGSINYEASILKRLTTLGVLG